jgi:hypothetical protein
MSPLASEGRIGGGRGGDSRGRTGGINVLAEGGVGECGNDSNPIPVVNDDGYEEISGVLTSIPLEEESDVDVEDPIDAEDADDAVEEVLVECSIFNRHRGGGTLATRLRPSLNGFPSNHKGSRQIDSYVQHTDTTTRIS